MEFDNQDLIDEIYKDIGKIKKIHPNLFFTAITKDVFEEKAVDDAVIVYISNILTKFLSTENLYKLGNYMIDMLKIRGELDSYRRYLADIHIGDYSLFFTGVFPEIFKKRIDPYKPIPPDKSLYFYFGKKAYMDASNSFEARKLGLDELFENLSKDFEEYSYLLNIVKERHMPNKKALTDLMLKEYNKYKETKNMLYLQKARSIADVLNIRKEQFPDLYRNL